MTKEERDFWTSLKEFLDAHKYISDDSLEFSGETLMDGPKYLKLRKATQIFCQKVGINQCRL